MIKAETAIKIENLSKVYKLYEKPSDRVKEAVNIFGKIYHKDFYALKNVSLEITKGSSVGVIGKNGSGKSTLLKIITGVLTPTEGSIKINGNISALLELGAGFNPELTGIENVYFNGSLMGFTREQMKEKLDDIMGFADIGEYINQPVKMYSSGMFVRLAFSVAINTEPDILIVDEALAVGDIRFQNRCFNKINSFREDGKTILFVTHATNTVLQYCNRCLWLDNGKIVQDGVPKEVVTSYMKSMRGFQSQEVISNNKQINPIEKVTEGKNLEEMFYYNPDEVRYGTFDAEIIQVIIKNSKGQVTNNLFVREAYKLMFTIKCNRDIEELYCSFGFKNQKGQDLFIYRGSKNYENFAVKNCKAGDIFTIEISHTMPLTNWDNNKYTLTPSISRNVTEDDEETLDDCVLSDIRYNSIFINVLSDGKSYAGPFYDKVGVEVIR